MRIKNYLMENYLVETPKLDDEHLRIWNTEQMKEYFKLLKENGLSDDSHYSLLIKFGSEFARILEPLFDNGKSREDLQEVIKRNIERVIKGIGKFDKYKTKVKV